MNELACKKRRRKNSSKIPQRKKANFTAGFRQHNTTCSEPIFFRRRIPMLTWQIRPRNSKANNLKPKFPREIQAFIKGVLRKNQLLRHIRLHIRNA